MMAKANRKRGPPPLIAILRLPFNFFRIPIWQRLAACGDLYTPVSTTLTPTIEHDPKQLTTEYSQGTFTPIALDRLRLLSLFVSLCMTEHDPSKEIGNSEMGRYGALETWIVGRRQDHTCTVYAHEYTWLRELAAVTRSRRIRFYQPAGLEWACSCEALEGPSVVKYTPK